MSSEIAIAQPKTDAIALFQHVFGFRPEPHFQGMQWMSGATDLISIHEQFQQFSIDLTSIADAGQRLDWIKHVNAHLDQPLFNAQIDSDGAQFFAVADTEMLRHVQAEHPRCKGSFDFLFDKAYKAEINRIIEDAFNLRLDDPKQKREERWGGVTIKIHPYKHRHANGLSERNLGLFFCTGGMLGFPVTGYALLEQEILRAFETSGNHFPTGVMPNAEKLFDLFKTGGPHAPITRAVPLANYATEMPVLNLRIARIMADMGVCVDLNSIVDHHMYDIAHLGPITRMDHQAQDAARCLAVQFNLLSLLPPGSSLNLHYKGHAILHVRGQNAHSSFSLETGRAVYADSEPGDETEPPADLAVSIEMPFLCEQDARHLSVSAQSLLDRHFEARGIPVPDKRCSAAKPNNDWGIKIPYEYVEPCLSSGERIDMGPLVGVFNEIQRQRIDAMEAVARSLEDTFGHALDEYVLFREYYTDEAIKTRDREIRFFLSQDLPTQRNEILLEGNKNQLPCIYDEIAERFQSILSAHGLSNILVGSHAVCMAGGFTSHCIDVEIPLQTITQLEQMAQKLAPLKDQISPLVRQAIALSSLERVFQTVKFRGGDTADTINPFVQGIIRSDYIKAMEQMRGEDANVEEAAASMKSVERYIAYFTRITQSPDPAVAFAARDHLAAIATLSPALNTLTAEAGKDCTPQLTDPGQNPLPLIPAPAGG